MSADNYIYVRKRQDGKFGVSMRFASSYYDDDYTPEQLPPEADESWIARAPNDEYGAFDTAEEALMAAHRAYQEEAIVEYGVSTGPGVA